MIRKLNILHMNPKNSGDLNKFFVEYILHQIFTTLKQSLKILTMKSFIMHPITKKPMPLFSIEQIFNINCTLYCKTSVYNPRKSRCIPQCMNCQLYGHSKNFCTKTRICVKCTGKHSSSDCQHPDNDALSVEHHTAYYGGLLNL